MVTAGARPTDNQTVILHPSGFSSLYAYGVTGGQQVGHGWPERPLATGWQTVPWLGTAESVINLDPGGLTDLRAYGTWLGLQAGWQWNTNRLFDTTKSVLDVQPKSTYLVAQRIGGRQQVRYHELSDTWGIEYALLWSGTVNDTPMTYGVMTGPSHTSLSRPEPKLTYTAKANFNGSDRFVSEVKATEEKEQAKGAEEEPTNLKKYIGAGICVFTLLTRLARNGIIAPKGSEFVRDLNPGICTCGHFRRALPPNEAFS